MFLTPKNDVRTLLSIEVIQATQNQKAAHFNQNCSGFQVDELAFLILFKSLPVEKILKHTKI